MALLKYKDYIASVDYSVDDKVFYGKLFGIDDYVDFFSENASEIENEFHKAVDDYLAFCKEIGKQPEKAYKGSFNIRISPELHRQLAIEATAENISLNQHISDILEHRKKSQYATV